MAYFRLPRDAEDWFKHISKEFSVQWDMYYLCLMCGLKEHRLGYGPPDSAKDLVDKFPGDYAGNKPLLIGALLHAEFARNAIDPQNRAAVESLVKGLLDPNSPTGLTDEGIRLMNQYAAGGFEYLRERLDPPQLMEGFLQFYVEQFG